MKRKISAPTIVVAAVLLVGLFAYLVQGRVKGSFTAEGVDQACTITSGGIGPQITTTSTETFQTFIPQKDYVSKIKINVSVEGLTEQTLTLRVYRIYLGDNLVATKSLTVQNTASSATFDVPDFQINPGALYKMVLTTNTNNSDWIVNMDPGDCYPNNGTSYTNGVMNQYDFGFVTYGYDIVPEPEPEEDTTPPPATTKSTTPATPTTQTTETPAPVSTAVDANEETETEDGTAESATEGELFLGTYTYGAAGLVTGLVVLAGFLLLYELKLKKVLKHKPSKLGKKPSRRKK